MNLLKRLFRQKPSDPAEDLIDWLSRRSLDDRRYVVGILYGGPYSLRVCKWILTRPDCDMGTASMLLWNFGVPHSLLGEPDRFSLSDEVKRELIAFIVDRWNAGEFAPAVFEWDTREHVKVYRRTLGRKGLKGRDPFRISDEAWQPIEGRRPEPAAGIGDDNVLGELLIQLKLADLAAINPKDWEPVRRKRLGLR